MYLTNRNYRSEMSSLYFTNEKRIRLQGLLLRGAKGSKVIRVEEKKRGEAP